jgi:hypothetical protein
MEKKSVVVYGKSSGTIMYDELMQMLELLTGVKWGYVKAKRRVRYLSAEGIKPTIAVRSKHDKKIKNPATIIIEKLDYSEKYWDDIILMELKSQLVGHLQNDNAGVINQWKPSREFQCVLMMIDEQQKKYPNAKANDNNTFDAWEDACINSKLNT